MPIILDGTTGITTPGITNTGTFVFQGPVQVPAGSAATASITTAAGANTGIFFPSSSSVAITTAGVERFSVASNGDVQMGAASATVLRSLSGTITNLLATTATVSASTYLATASGSVGVGTSSPGGKLNIVQAKSGTAAESYDMLRLNLTGTAAIGDSSDIVWYNGSTKVVSINGILGADNALYGTLTFSTRSYNTDTLVEAVRIDNRSNVGIGTTNPGQKLDVASAGTVAARIYNTASTTDAYLICKNSSGESYFGVNSTGPYIYTASAQAMVFYTNNAERARISSGGQFCIGTTGTAGDARLRVVNEDNTSGDFLIVGQMGGNAINTSSYQYIGGNYAGSDNVYIYGNGNIVNTNNSYGTLSDVKLKQDIIDAASQWDDVKAFKFRKFRFKEEVSRNPNAPHQLGLIAQELEQTSPGLVDTTPDRQKEGETMKTIKTSVLLMKATKALQEAMARIEVLEADMAVMKGLN